MMRLHVHEVGVGQDTFTAPDAEVIEVAVGSAYDSGWRDSDKDGRGEQDPGPASIEHAGLAESLCDEDDAKIPQQRKHEDRSVARDSDGHSITTQL
jgi:hypothetical protein